MPSTPSFISSIQNLMCIFCRCVPVPTPTRFRKFRKTIYFKLLILFAIAAISFVLLASVFGGRNGDGSHVFIKDSSKFESDLRFSSSGDNSFAIKSNTNPLIDVIGNIAAAMGVLGPPGNELKPGEKGKPFRLPKNMTEGQKKLVDEGWKKHQFNQFVSDMISVRRSVPDPRDKSCKTRSTLKVLPPTSVIMCFHNEAWSTLLRSVHSVLERSPPQLLREIILVDDFSEMDHLKHQLDLYFASYPKVKIIRSKKREGLIRARLMGAAVAKGPVLTFLDSHIEANVGWLEPLLYQITRDPTRVVCPVIDVIDENTFEYQHSSHVSIGGFNWNLQFSWHQIPEKDRKNSTEPIRTPTMAGGLFSIDKHFFEKLGTYDSGFDIWGGENLELSFKTWMCGGTLLIVPCSHVGHIFRKKSPYKWRSGSNVTNVVRRNSMRLAKVWMDEYADYYYQRISYDFGDFGDISSRLKLRAKLRCKSFKWYITNVYPDLYVPGDAVAYGEIRNLGMGGTFCLDSPATKRNANETVGLYTCHGQSGNQYWSYSKTGEIRRDEMCIDYAGKDVVVLNCHGSLGNQRWIYDHVSGHVRHGPSRRCLAIISTQKIQMEKCDSLKETQRWRFQNYNSSAATALNSLK